MKISAVLLLAFSTVTAIAQSAAPGKFTNPLLPSGPDPWVVADSGHYYFTCTTAKNLTLWKTDDITDLRHAEKKVVWTPEPGKPWSQAIWAPEMIRWNNTWYLYFAASDGDREGRRIWVLENPSSDPLDGTWTMKGKVSDASDLWAIDPDVFELNGSHYILWSGWQSTAPGVQRIYIAHMSNPWTIDSPRTLIASPTYAWEKHSEGQKNGETIQVNEGPEALIHGGKVFVVYSASACWTDEYQLGVVEADASSNLLSADSWKKFDHPFFAQDPQAHVFAPGHNGFFKSPDGKEDWIIYHANSETGQGCGPHRSPRIQKFGWNADGTPDFGTPISTDTPLDKPSGTVERVNP